MRERRCLTCSDDLPPEGVKVVCGVAGCYHAQPKPSEPPMISAKVEVRCACGHTRIMHHPDGTRKCSLIGCDCTAFEVPMVPGSAANIIYHEKERYKAALERIAGAMADDWSKAIAREALRGEKP